MTAGLGWTLGDYVIGTPIDAGKFGTVYEAKHLPTGREVALKLIPLQGVEGDEKVAAERHGAMLQASFSQAHRGLVPEVFEHQQIVTFYAISMELVRGQQLTDLIAAGPIPSKRAAEIALAICTFLEKAHQFETSIEGVHYKLIVHADLKPDHILLLENGEIRVLDFGIAKALAERTNVTTNKWGSVHYASPERLQSDGHVNEHADFWSLGVMLFEMVAGFRPYRQYEHNVSRLDAAIRRQETREPVPVAGDPVLATIVNKLLASQIERRYSSAGAITSDLRAFLHGGPVAAAAELAEANQETVRIRPMPGTTRRTTSSQATEALPVRAASALGAAVPTIAAAVSMPAVLTGRAARSAARRAARAAAPPRRSIFLRGVRIILVFWFISFIASQIFDSMRGSRFESDISDLDAADVSSARDVFRTRGYENGVGEALKTRMLSLADRAILAYRAGMAQVARAQWEQARDSLDLAAEISPDDPLVASKRSYVRGQLLRIMAKDQTDVDGAVEAFQESARLDPSSPDPHLGLARIFAYSIPDIDALSRAIRDAEERGFTAGRRERAQFGDVYKIRADKARSEAARLDGSDRIAQLESAAADYGKCVEYFDDLSFFNAEENLRQCRRRLAVVTGELRVLREPDGESREAVEL